MAAIFWQECGILLVAALLGAVAVVPYSLRLAKGKPLRFSTPVSFLLSLLQNGILFAVVIGLGVWAAHAIGLGAPYIEALLSHTTLPSSRGLLAALCLGILAGATLLIADLFFEPYWPQAIRTTALKTTFSENLLASFYGGINEEILMRLFGLSVLAWLFSFVSHTINGAPTLIALWVANVVMTIIFGAGHLPALKQLLGTMPRLMVIRSLLLNAPVGLICGWLFWTYGIEVAIVAHFATDIVYHVIGTFVLRKLATG